MGLKQKLPQLLAVEVFLRKRLFKAVSEVLEGFPLQKYVHFWFQCVRFFRDHHRWLGIGFG
jgi:hypothetical protein